MRNGNDEEAFRKIFIEARSYRTYEEWKLNKKNKLKEVINMFLPYL